MQSGFDCNSPESRKAVFRTLVDLYAAGDVAAMDRVIPPDYIGHTSVGDRDREEFFRSISFFHSLFIYTKDTFPDRRSVGRRREGRYPHDRQCTITGNGRACHLDWHQHRSHRKREDRGRVEHLGTAANCKAAGPFRGVTRFYRRGRESRGFFSVCTRREVLNAPAEP